jgi:putative PEP-CTERM system TPR-repeat lipoprotein
MNNFFRPLALTTLAFLLFAGCSKSLTVEELLARAEQAMQSGDYQSAEVDAKAILQREPRNPAARTIYGQIYLEKSEPAAAVEQFERALESGTNPATTILLMKALIASGNSAEVVSAGERGDYQLGANEPDFHAVLARAYLYQRDYASARSALARAQPPHSPFMKITQALFAFNLDDNPDAATEILKSVVEEYPDEADAWRLLASIALDGRDRESALEYLGRAVDADPSRLVDRLQQINLLLDMGAVDEAEKSMQPLRGSISDNPGVAFLEGRMLYDKGLYKSALDAFSIVLGFLPDHPGALLLAAHSNIREDNIATAEQQLARYRGVRPSDIDATLLHASLLLRLDRADRAEQLSRNLLEEHGMNSKAVGVLATALAAQGLHAESTVYLEQLAAEIPDSSVALAALGSQELLAGDAQAGVASLQAAVNLEPENFDARRRLIEAQLRLGETDAAEKLAEEYLALEDSAAGWVLMGRVRAAQQRVEDAEQAFRRALQLSPSDTQASANLAALFFLSGDPDQAREILETALEESPGDLATSMRLAIVLEQQQDFEVMEQVLSAAVERNPAAVEPRVALARSHLRNGEAADAIALLAPIAEEARGGAEILDVLVRSYLAAGELEPAETYGRRLLALQPEDAETLALVGQVAMRRGRFESAEQHFRGALEQYPQDVMLRKLLIETLVYRSRFEAASDEIAALPPAVQEEAPVLLLRGRLAMVAQDFAQAEDLLARAHDMQPSTSTLAFLAGAVWASGDRQQSVDLLETWLKNNPEDSAIRMQLASRQLELGNNSRARQLYGRVLESQPNSVVALNNMAWLSRNDDPEAALEYIQRADDLVPDSSEIMDTYAMVLMAAGDVEEALLMNTEAVEGAPDNPDILFNRAQILVQAGRGGEAAALLEELVARPVFASQEAARELLDSLQ